MLIATLFHGGLVYSMHRTPKLNPNTGELTCGQDAIGCRQYQMVGGNESSSVNGKEVVISDDIEFPTKLREKGRG